MTICHSDIDGLKTVSHILDEKLVKTRLGCFCVTPILSWGCVKVEIEDEVDLRLRLKWGWFELEVEVRLIWGWGWDEVKSKFSWSWVGLFINSNFWFLLDFGVIFYFWGPKWAIFGFGIVFKNFFGVYSYSWTTFIIFYVFLNFDFWFDLILGWFCDIVSILIHFELARYIQTLHWIARYLQKL